MAEQEKIILEVDGDELTEEKIKKNVIRVLAFGLGGENYCVGMNQAKEVIRIPQITKVPNSERFIVGIINLRGDIISLLDIRSFFNLKEEEKTKQERILITDVSGESVGVMVDNIKGTLEIEEEYIQPPLPTLKGNLSSYTKGQVNLENEILIMLDLAKILKCEEIENLRKGREL